MFGMLVGQGGWVDWAQQMKGKVSADAKQGCGSVAHAAHGVCSSKGRPAHLQRVQVPQGHGHLQQGGVDEGVSGAGCAKATCVGTAASHISTQVTDLRSQMQIYRPQMPAVQQKRLHAALPHSTKRPHKSRFFHCPLHGTRRPPPAPPRMRSWKAPSRMASSREPPSQSSITMAR